MNAREMQIAVENSLHIQNPLYESKFKLKSSEVFYYLTMAERDYVQDVYNDGIDRNEENKKKLGKLLVSSEIDGVDLTANTFYPNSFEVAIPTDVLYAVNERAKITSNGTEIDNVYIKPISYDEYNVNKENPFRKPTIDKCLRLEGVDKHIILLPSEGTQVLDKIYLDYVKTPLGIDINQDCELHSNVHPNIVKIAVKLILGAKSDQVGYGIQSKEELQNK